MYVKFVFLAFNLLLKRMELNTNESDRYIPVLSPGKDQTTIIQLFLFHSFSSLLVTFWLIFPHPFPA